MRYTRKNISELLDTVKGGPDVKGFSTSNIGGYWYTLVPSFGGSQVWQSSTGGRMICSEDGARIVGEDVGSMHC